MFFIFLLIVSNILTLIYSKKIFGKLEEIAFKVARKKLNKMIENEIDELDQIFK